MFMKHALLVIVSALALIVPKFVFPSFDQKGTKPQRMMVSSRSSVSAFSRTTGCQLCGATLYEGAG
jgi:hypothetical protein